MKMIFFRGLGSFRRVVTISIFLLITCILYLFVSSGFRGFSGENSGNAGSSCQVQTSRETVIFNKDGTAASYDRTSPLIFIGGFPRSGTTLARAMLDAHGDIRCGEETRVVPRILQLAAQWNRSAKESNRLHEAGLTDAIIRDAVAAFILEVVVKHGEPAPRLCNKDPFTLKYGVYLLKLFPSAKFIFMIRDGRAVVHSLITRKVTVTGFDLTDYRQCLSKWSNSMKTMSRECDELGPERCLRVKYEDLVLHPRKQMYKILAYLDLQWSEDVLHHEKYINKPGGVSLSKVERSSDQVVKPVNVQALSKWVGSIPDDILQEMDSIAPMLRVLGYDPNDHNPSYGVPDPEVATNTNDILVQPEKWMQSANDVLKQSKHESHQ